MNQGMAMRVSASSALIYSASRTVGYENAHNAIQADQNPGHLGEDRPAGVTRISATGPAASTSSSPRSSSGTLSTLEGAVEALRR